MNFTWIECFLATAEQKNYSKAAEKLNMTQPTVSRYIANLEAELGFVLLDRTTRKVDLTKAGELYYQMFSGWMVELEEMGRKAQALQTKEKKILRIGFLEGWLFQDCLAQAASRVSQRLPEVDLRFINLGLSEILERLSAHTLDLGMLLGTPLIDQYHLGKRLMKGLRKVLLYSARHPLAGREGLTPRDFSGETFFALDEDGEYAARRIREFCEPYGFLPRTSPAENIQTIHANVQRGVGVAIVDEWAPGVWDSLFKTLPLSAVDSAYLVWESGHLTPEATTFLEHFYL